VSNTQLKTASAATNTIPSNWEKAPSYPIPTNNTAARIINGRCRRTVSSSTSNGLISADTPSTSPMLAMFEPMIVPYPSVSPKSNPERIAIANSGAVVANAITVTPTMAARIPTSVANRAAPRTNASAPTYNRRNPSRIFSPAVPPNAPASAST
jgi:hypothetical protein